MRSIDGLSLVVVLVVRRPAGCAALAVVGGWEFWQNVTMKKLNMGWGKQKILRDRLVLASAALIWKNDAGRTLSCEYTLETRPKLWGHRWPGTLEAHREQAALHPWRNYTNKQKYFVKKIVLVLVNEFRWIYVFVIEYVPASCTISLGAPTKQKNRNDYTSYRWYAFLFCSRFLNLIDIVWHKNTSTVGYSNDRV